MAEKKPTTKEEPTPKAPRKKVGLPGIIGADGAKVASLGKNQVSYFVNFLRQQGVVGLAVGLAVGTAAGAAVKEIVNDLINPIVGYAIGGIDLTKVTWVIVRTGANGKGGLVIGWGAILSSLITLLATALVVYLIVHGAKLDRLDQPKA